MTCPTPYYNESIWRYNFIIIFNNKRLFEVIGTGCFYVHIYIRNNNTTTMHVLVLTSWVTLCLHAGMVN